MMPFGSTASFALYSRTTKPQFIVASLIFLMTRTFDPGPVPRDPRKIAALDDPDAKVNEDQMAVAHGAEV
jgi:hypothetical protein